MAARRDLSIAEMEVMAELATAAPELVTAKDQLLGALAAPVGAQGGGRLAWTPALESKSWGQLIEAVRLGIIQPKEAKRFVNIPQGEPGVVARLARLRWQRGAM